MHWVAKPRFGREGDGLVFSNCDHEPSETMADFLSKADAESAPRPLGCDDSHADHEEAHSAAGIQSVEYAAARDDAGATEGAVGTVGAAGAAGAAVDIAAAVTKVGKDMSRQLTDVMKQGAHPSSMGLMDHTYGTAGMSKSERTKAEKAIEDKRTKESGARQSMFDAGGQVFQQYHPVAKLHGRYVVTSAWVVRGMPAGACFREDIVSATNNDSCFIPHWVQSDVPCASSASSASSAHAAYPVTEHQANIRDALYGRDKAYADPDGRGEDKRTATRPSWSYAVGGYGRMVDERQGR
jgi:hypothetical protein